MPPLSSGPHSSKRARVERRRRQQQEPLGGVEVRVVLPAHQAHDAAVRYGDAFGPAGGTGGVDDVSQRRTVTLQRQIGFGLTRQHGGGGDQVHYGDAGQTPVLVCEHHPAAGIGEHELQPFRRIVPVERHIRAAGFKMASTLTT